MELHALVGPVSNVYPFAALVEEKLLMWKIIRWLYQAFLWKAKT